MLHPRRGVDRSELLTLPASIASARNEHYSFTVAHLNFNQSGLIIVPIQDWLKNQKAPPLCSHAVLLDISVCHVNSQG
jgi:hypothetical protein